MRRVTALAFAISVFGQAGCSTLNNTEKGVGLGALIGTGVGTALGAATGNPKTGAVVGGLTGAGIGGLIGNDVDRTEKKQKDRQDVIAAQAYADAQPGRMEEIVTMFKSGQSERVIINHIQQNHLRFALSANDLNYLKSCAVPDAVIMEMQNSNQRGVVGPHRPVVVREEVIIQEPVYIHRRPPPVVFVDPYAPPGFGMHFRTYR